MDLLVLGPSPAWPRPLSELATRDELTTWLTRVLFGTFIRGRSEPPPYDIRLPHNLTAFVGLLMYLHRVGYPGHWLSDLLARVLSGSMVSNIVPYAGEYPVPVEEHSRRVPLRTVRTDPWVIELETIIATVYNAIPFSVAIALPTDLLRDPSDIAIWEVQVTPTALFSSAPEGFYESPYHPCTHLLLYRSDKVVAKALIPKLPDIFEGRSSPTPGTFFILTGQEHVMYLQKIQFRLSKKRMERMRKDKRAVVAYRHDTGVQGE